MKGRPVVYSKEELEWIFQHSKLLRTEAHRLFVKRFGREDVSFKNIKGLCERKGWRTERENKFAKGNIPHNKGLGRSHDRSEFVPIPVGTERVNSEGYIERKIRASGRRWRAVHLIEWERLHGPVPKGMVLKCLDGDRGNADPTNWEAVPRAILPHLIESRNGIDYDKADPEVKPSIMALAKLRHAARRRGKKV